MLLKSLEIWCLPHGDLGLNDLLTVTNGEETGTERRILKSQYRAFTINP